MDDLLQAQDELQKEAKELLETTPVLELLGKLGQPTETGSSITGMMVYPDLDFAVQTETPDVQVAIDLVPEVFSRLDATACKVADFKSDTAEGASYFIGFEVPFRGKSWPIAATVGRPGPIIPNPPELTEWLQNMTEQQRETILRLKKELIDANRYAGAKAQPPYTLRSVHLYEAVFRGSATTISDLEAYFK